MIDPAARETDKIIAEIEGRIKIEYTQAEREIKEKLDGYLKRFQTKDKTWNKWVAEGKKTKEEYKQWRIGQIAIGERWEEMRQTIAEDLLHTHEIATSMAKGYMPEVYALNHDYATFQVERDSKVDTSYTLYRRETAERLMGKDPELLPGPGKKVSQDIAEGKAIRWNKQRIQSAMMQALLQGESIPDIATRLTNAVGEGDRKSMVRNARTMATYAQNSGRLDAYKRAERMGIKNRKQWIATLDSRTRHWHRDLDGQVRDLDEYFENEKGKIMCPGDPEADGANVYNCRCTMISVLPGHEIDVTDMSLRNTNHMEETEYEEWKESRQVKSNPILLPEEKADAIRGRYIHEYRGFGGETGTGRNPDISVDYAPKADAKTGSDAESETRRIDDAVAAAKEHSYDYYKEKYCDKIYDSLTDQEKESIEVYTGGSYSWINKSLRGQNTKWFGTSDPEEREKQAEGIRNNILDLTNILDKSVLDDDIILHRGMSHAKTLANELGVSNAELENLIENKSIIGLSFAEKGFCSTSIGGLLEDFEKEVNLEIIVPKGARGMFIDPVSATPGENEFLLQQGSRFEVIDCGTMTDSYGDLVYKLKVIVTGQVPQDPKGLVI